MQALTGSFAVTSSRVTQPPRSASFRGSRSRLLRSPKPLGHAAQRLNGSVVNFSAATEAEPAVPLVSDNAAAEVPHAEVASQDDLSAAIEKTESGPDTTSDGQPQLKQQQQQQPSVSAGPRGNGAGRPGGRASRRARTVGPEQLVPGAQFEGNVVSVMAYGCFVDIGALTDGLVHISQLADEYVPDPNLVVQNGQTVKVRVQSWDPSKNRLSLTMKPETSSAGAGAGGGGGAGGYLDRQGDRQPRQGKVARAGGGSGQNRRPQESKPLPFKVGDKMMGTAHSVTGWGAFFDIGEGIRGLLHIDEMIWPEGNFAPSAHDCMKEGDQTEVYVLKIQKGNKVALTQKTPEQRQAEETMAKSGAGTSKRKATHTLEAALAAVGFKTTPKPKKEHKEKEASSAEAATGATAEVPAPTADIPAPTAEAPADDPAATDNQATVELGKGEQDDALQRQINPKGDPTPMELPPEAQKAKEDADQAALEGEESGEAGQGELGTADTSNSVEVTAPKDEATAAPSEVAEGEDPPAVNAQLDAVTPQKESNLPQDAPKQVAEGEGPDQAGQTEKPGTADDSSTVEVTAPQEPDTAAPAEIAEGEESPTEAATSASLSTGAQAPQADDKSSAAALAGAESAEVLPGTQSKPAQASPAGVDSTESERTAPPAAAPQTTADSANSAAAGTSTPPAGGSSGSVSALSVSEPETKASSASVSAADVKQLRQETGAGMMDCKRALTAANGDIQKATEALKKKGLAAADKKAGRIAAEGLLAQYIHAGSRLGVIVEVNCETDFVARGDVFKQLASDMAMQVAACPQVTVVDISEVPADVVEKERSVQLGKEDIVKKPENIRGKIVDGRIQKFLAEQALLEQAFIKDTSKTVATLIKEATATVGEKISIRRFERYQLGEGLEKKESDLAQDVEEQQAALQAKAAEKKTQEPAAPVEQIPDQPSVKVDAKLVKQLRDSSGAGMMDCKKALANNDNNLEKATEFLRKKGLASADKKAGRMASEGAIASYVHAGSKLGVLIEVNCETDFVARGAKFKELVQDLAMQAAASPSAIVVSLQDVPEAEIERERAIEMGKEDIQNKPEAIRPKIVEGRLNKIRSQKALLEQAFIKDTGSTVAEHIKSAVASLGENIQIRRFTRYNLGEGIQKKQEDFAAEVAAQTGQ